MQMHLTAARVAKLEPADKTVEVFDTQCKGLSVRVEPTGRRVYRLRYRFERKRQVFTLGDATVLSTVAARELARQILGDAARGIDPLAARRAARQHTLQSFLDSTYEPWAVEHLKSGTEQVRRIRVGFAALLGKRLSDLTAFAIERIRTARVKGGTKKATINKDCHALRAALGRGVRWQMLEQNPLKDLKPLKETDSKTIIRFLTADEERALFRALDAREEDLRRGRDSFNCWLEKRGMQARPDLRALPFADHLKPMVILSLHTGVRRGELFSMKWRDVDLTRGMLTVAGATAKSGKARHIPLNGPALDALTRWREQTGGADGDLIFKSARTGSVYITLKKSWAAVLQAAGIRNFRWHDQRHCFASKMVMSGIDLNVVRELLGHADLRTTIRYSHLAPENLRRAVDAIAAPAALDNVIELGDR